MADPITLPNPMEMEAGDTLDKEQLALIEESKNEDWNAPAKEPDKKEDKKVVTDEDKKVIDDKIEDKPPEGELTPEEEKAKKEADEAENKELERLEKKAKELEKSVDEVKEIETQEKSEKERLEKVAEEEEMTIEEVIELEAKDKQLAERHGSDPLKLARTLRKEQSEYGKIKAENESLKSFKDQAEANRKLSWEKDFNVHMEAERDKIIEKFEERYPKEAEGLSDDAMFERGKALVREHFKEKEKEVSEKRAEEAKDKRKVLIDEVKKEYKEFVPEIKDMLKDCDDRQVLDAGFDVKFLANFVRGKKYTPEHLKTLEDLAYKRGVEQPKIIPKVKGGKPDAGSRDSKTSSKGSTLSGTDKARAEDMYGRRDGWTKERMWDEYAKDDKGNDF